MKVYITKYALTEGIYSAEADLCSDRMIVIRSSDRLPTYVHGEGKDWHRTPQAAIQRAEVMRLKAIQSVKKKLASLQAMKFEISDAFGEDK